MKCSICQMLKNNPRREATHFFRQTNFSEYQGYWGSCKEHSIQIDGVEPATEEEVIIFQTERLLE